MSSCRTEPAAAGADRRAQRHFALACRAAREQQVGDVGARDEQHARHRAEQDQDRGAHAPDDVLLIALDEDAVAALARRRGEDRPVHALEILLRLRDGHARFHPADCLEPQGAAALPQVA